MSKSILWTYDRFCRNITEIRDKKNGRRRDSVLRSGAERTLGSDQVAAQGCCDPCCCSSHSPAPLSQGPHPLSSSPLASPGKVTGVGSQNEFLPFQKGMWQNHLTPHGKTIRSERANLTGFPVCCHLFRINKVKIERRVGNPNKIPEGRGSSRDNSESSSLSVFSLSSHSSLVSQPPMLSKK